MHDYALARWLPGNGVDTEDVVQDARLREFKGIGGFKEVDVRAWMLTIVRRAAYGWLGRSRPATLVVTNNLEAIECAETERGSPNGPEVETPGAALIAKADAERLKAAIRGLPVPFRETLVLRDLLGFDYREIAGMTGVPIGTVMSRLALGRHRLIATLAKHEV